MQEEDEDDPAKPKRLMELSRALLDSQDTWTEVECADGAALRDVYTLCQRKAQELADYDVEHVKSLSLKELEVAVPIANFLTGDGTDVKPWAENVSSKTTVETLSSHSASVYCAHTIGIFILRFREGAGINCYLGLLLEGFRRSARKTSRLCPTHMRWPLQRVKQRPALGRFPSLPS